ncbi:S-layer homology domain-containing protein [Planococcus chinensis]|uniref:S-layer homology domain-containing protein n=1 Tax=Planococcus chinensis TaxID=272917 RepID=A0ABW4QEQ7_9BACL
MKQKLTTIFAVLMSLVLFAPSVFAAADLPEDHRFYEEMTYLLDKGVITGYSNGTVQPDKPVTRAEAAIMIGRLKGFDGEQKATPFSDVPKGHIASGYIAEAAAAGLLSGYPNGTYNPDAPIVRGDMAIILDRMFRLEFRLPEDFRDVTPGMKAHGAIERILAAHITIGYADHTFRPAAKVTRGSFAAFLARGLEPKFKNDAKIPHSYLRDMTKTYTYNSPQGLKTDRYIDVPDKNGLRYGFMWTEEVAGKTTPYLMFENYSELGSGLPYSEGFVVLDYPAVKGQVFYNPAGDHLDMYIISGINETVGTPYKTFTNAVVVGDGRTTYYMVEGYGNVKTIDREGNVLHELVDVK